MDLSNIKKFVPLVIALAGVVLIIGGIVYPKIKTEEPEVVVEKSETATSSTATKFIIVDVEGAVEKPGVYQIPYDSRIVDALIPAGGLSANADRNTISKTINLAQKLTDGTKIYFPEINNSNISNNSNATNLINVNNASITELDSLPGVGAITAQKIIDNRPYQNTSDLLTKKVVSSSVYSKIKDKLSVY